MPDGVKPTSRDTAPSGRSAAFVGDRDPDCGHDCGPDCTCFTSPPEPLRKIADYLNQKGARYRDPARDAAMGLGKDFDLDNEAAAAPVLGETPDLLLAAAREYAAESRATHVAWVEHYEGEPCGACTPEVVEAVGDLDVHREWVRKYDVILLALDLVDETLAVRLVDAVARLADEGMRDRAVYFAQRALRYRKEARGVAA